MILDESKLIIVVVKQIKLLSLLLILDLTELLFKLTELSIGFSELTILLLIILDLTEVLFKLTEFSMKF